MPLEAASAAALWTGLLLILLLVLSTLVVRQRRTHRVAHGDGGVPQVLGAVRAFGNASEYIPAGIGALAVLALAGASPLIVHLAGALLLTGRVIHAIGLTRTMGVSRFRVIGMTLTWVAYLFSAIALLLFAIA